MVMNNVIKSAGFAAVLILMIPTAWAHVTVQPKQTTAGALQKYTMRVPTEKFVPTVRIEVEFPATLSVSSFESKAAWKIEEERGTSGNLLGVILTGSIPTGESSEFNFTARNPNEEGMLSWKVIQIYEDGSKSEWTGPQGSRTPAPSVEVKKF